MASIGPLRPDAPIPWSCVLARYITPDCAGEMTVRIQCHDDEDIADLADVSDRVVLEAEAFTLRVLPRKLARSEVGAVDIAAALDRMRLDAPRVLTSVPYQRGRVYVGEGIAGEEALLAHGWNALPGLLNALDEPGAGFDRRAWALALLYDLTGAVDPREIAGAIGDWTVLAGFYDKRYDFPTVGMTHGWGTRQSRDGEAQEQLIRRWRALRPLVQVVD